MSVEISDEQDVPIDLDRLRSRLEGCLERAGISDSELSLLLTDDNRMADLNRTYRNTPSTTDVLSFPLGNSDSPVFGNLLGDVVVSVPMAQRQAAEAGVALDDEIETLAFHGLLHLLGRDHDVEGWEAWDRALEELRPDG